MFLKFTQVDLYLKGVYTGVGGRLIFRMLIGFHIWGAYIREAYIRGAY